MNQKFSFVSAFVVLCAAALPSWAQEVSAGIIGRVTDPTGSAIVGATVTAKDLTRGTEWPTRTNAEGIYAFPRIPAGDYEVRVGETIAEVLERHGRFVGLGIAVARWTALHDVGDVHLGAGQIDAFDQAG